MGVRSRSRLQRLAVLAAAAVVASTLAPPPAAHAEHRQDWHSISGTTYSTTTWYYSSTRRVKTGTGAVMAKFSTLPSGGGIFFGITLMGSQVMLGSSKFDTTNNTQTVRNPLAGGTNFRTAFRRVNPCRTCSNDFVGQLYY